MKVQITPQRPPERQNKVRQPDYGHLRMHAGCMHAHTSKPFPPQVENEHERHDDERGPFLDRCHTIHVHRLLLVFLALATQRRPGR